MTQNIIVVNNGSFFEEILERKNDLIISLTPTLIPLFEDGNVIAFDLQLVYATTLFPQENGAVWLEYKRSIITVPANTSFVAIANDMLTLSDECKKEAIRLKAKNATWNIITLIATFNVDIR